MAHTALDAIEYLRDKIVAANTDAGSSVYVGTAPQGTRPPYVVMEIISRTEALTQDSGSAVDTYRVQIDVWAKNTSSESGFKTCHDIADAVRTAISRVTDVSTYGHDIDGVQEVNHFTDFVPEIELYRVSNDYLIRVK